MRIAALIVLGSMFCQAVIAQVRSSQKPTKGTQASKRNEMISQMNEAVEALNKEIAEQEKLLADAIKNKEDEETIKGYRDQINMLKKQVEMMGGATRGIANISETKIRQLDADVGNPGVPERDDARIRMLPAEELTDGGLVVFVKKIHSEVQKLMSVEKKSDANKLYTALQLEKRNQEDISHVANTLWLCGDTETALFLMGTVCNTNPGNLNNLNNYASFLTMKGAEHAALPILQYLDNRAPNNSTILNNIAQAWFGLGDMGNANRYLAGTIRINRNHPHANETKSRIEKAEGNSVESTESLKRSLEEDYSPEKEAELNEKGYTVKFEDFKFKYPAKADQLGIEKFMFSIPEYPFEGGVTAQTSLFEWQDFRNRLNAARAALEQIKETQKIKAKNYEKKVLANPELLKPYNNRVYKTANRKLTLLITEWGLHRTMALNKEMMAAGDSVETWRKEYHNALRNLDDCGARKGLATSFLSKANLLLQQKNAEMLSLQKQILNAAANYSLYAYTDRSLYELAITDLKIKFLIFLAGMPCEFEVGCLATEAPEGTRGPLPDFDETNCEYKTELSVPYLQKYFSIKVECNKMTTNFDAKLIKGSLEENLANGKYKGTLEIQGKIGSDKISVGPVEMGTSVKAGAGIEFTESGIQDVYITSGAQVKAGSATVSSVEAKVSVVSGSTSLSGKGAFSGINIRL